ncbi:MAG: SWIM zinc finger family protein, partial [Methylococcales bacterium]|nr:SWIM zinc finger family protein [Methylococcales bacterium]
MATLKRIIQSDIEVACGATYYGRGEKYYRDGRVSGLKIDKDAEKSVIFSTSIEGSRNQVYQQHIRIDWKDDFTTVIVDGDCSCPIMYNCKHIAASCLEYLFLTTQILPSSGADNTSAACLDWLNEFNEDQSVPEQGKEIIIYVLEKTATKHVFSLNLIVTKYSKKGGLNKGRELSLNNLRYSYSYARYVQEEDKEIGSLLYSLDSNYSATPLIKGSVGFLALSKVLATGRLFLDNYRSAAPIEAGVERKLAFSWQQEKNNDYRVQVAIEPKAILLMTDPPLYLDASKGVVGPVQDLNISDKQLNKILLAPAVPERYVEEFSQRLTLEYPSIPLPAPKKIELVDITNIPPIPKITLFGEQVTETQYSHFIQVNFVYAHVTISAHKIEPFSTIKTDNGFFKIERGNQEEVAAIKQLLALGFYPNLTNPVKENEFILFSPAERSLIESANRWSEFMSITLPELEEKGWIIERDDNFKLNFQQADDWHAEIEETGHDWFEMNFQINVGGQPMALLPLIMPVIEEYELDELPENLNIQIAPYSYVNMPSSQLKPFLKIVYELFDSSSMSDDGGLLFSRFNAASLADLETHSYGIFSINGGKELIETGKKLKNFKGIENVAIPKGLNATLREYQHQGLNWLQFLQEYNFSGILADDMGLGKTVQTLAHLLVEKEAGRLNKPSLIIAPTSLMGNWRREAAKFTPDLTVLILQGTERKQHFEKIKDFDIVLTTYPLLPRDQDVLDKIDYYYLILDEAQVIKNPRSQAAQVVREIKTEHRLCLTGTPMENHLGELWAQFDFLMPGFLGDSKLFKKKYRTPIEVHADEHQRERLSKRLQPFMLRRTKQEVATELPAKTEIIRSVSLYEKQATLYESIRITMEKKVRDAIA